MTELEQLKKIIKDAPEGATHIDDDGCYVKQNDYEEHFAETKTYFHWCECWQEATIPQFCMMRSLSDIRERISLMKKLEKCQDLIRILTPYMASDSAKVNAKKLIGELNG